MICAYTAARLFHLAGSITAESFAHIMDGSMAQTDCVNTFRPYRPTEEYLLKRGLGVYHATEKYGLIWVCLKTPIADIPEFPAEVHDPSYRWDVTLHSWSMESERSPDDRESFGFLPFPLGSSQEFSATRQTPCVSQAILRLCRVVSNMRSYNRLIV